MELMVEEWETWKVEHGKTYGGHGLLGSTAGNSVGGGFSQTEHFRCHHCLYLIVLTSFSTSLFKNHFYEARILLIG